MVAWCWIVRLTVHWMTLTILSYRAIVMFALLTLLCCFAATVFCVSLSAYQCYLHTHSFIFCNYHQRKRVWQINYASHCFAVQFFLRLIFRWIKYFQQSSVVVISSDCWDCCFWCWWWWWWWCCCSFCSFRCLSSSSPSLLLLVMIMVAGELLS